MCIRDRSHPEYATTLSTVGHIYFNLNEYQKALEYYNKCEEIQKKVLGEFNADYASTLDSLAWIHFKLSDLAQSKDLNQRSIEVLKSLGLSDENPSFKSAKELNKQLA
eukprot:TRINITY_DN18940_c0_g1_i1.p1 TRINITY_DN18940_c0_g1~~TRINITY_DN18940_c0_g1_i1.p1  ORF type:complete len:108 (+),score=19.12 TRINITY_DN18940_c0_g1_i1:60-383(+)